MRGRDGLMVDVPGGVSLGSMVSYLSHRFMQLNLLKSKIHRAEVTDLSLNYEGSLAIDGDFMARVGLRTYERILVSNLNNGERFETYVHRRPRGLEDDQPERRRRLPGQARGSASPSWPLPWSTSARPPAWQPKVLVLGDANRKIVKQTGG